MASVVCMLLSIKRRVGRGKMPFISGVSLSLALLLPGVASAAEPTLPYTVIAGDTLIGVRDRLLLPGTSWQQLQRINRVADPRRLRPGSTLQLPLAWLRETDVTAAVLAVQGQVSLQRGDAPAQALAGGATLQRGDLVSTGAQSSAAIAFEGGTQLLLRPDSRLRIERITGVPAPGAGRIELQLDAGSADTQVPPPAAGSARPRLQMRTPVVNLGVRGTEFRAQADGERARLEVLQGRVDAQAATSTATATARQGQSQNQSQVNAGFGTLASPAGVLPPRALLPAPALDGVPALVERLPLQLPWPALPGAMAYRAQVFSADSGALQLDGLFATPRAQWADDLPDGNYELRLRAADADGLEGRDARHRFRLKARPEAPFITEPQAGAQTVSDSQRFRWSRHATATRYALQVADTPDFTPPLRVDRSDLTETEIDIALPLGTHHWRIASIENTAGGTADRGPWSDVQSISRVAPPPAPPASAVPQSTPDGLLIRWPRVAQPGVRYGVQIARDAAFAELLADGVSDDPQWLLPSELPPPQPSTVYMRVRSIAADGLDGPYGKPQQIELPQPRPWWLLLPALLLLLL